METRAIPLGQIRSNDVNGARISYLPERTTAQLYYSAVARRGDAQQRQTKSRLYLGKDLLGLRREQSLTSEVGNWET